MTTADYLPTHNSRYHLDNATEHTFRGDLQILSVDSVPTLARNFYIGDYQPAQKWLYDRKGRVLDFEDIMHYQRIIKALTETDRVMKETDGVGV